MKPKVTFALLATAGALALSFASATSQAATAQITVEADRPSHPVSPTLWGIFFEDINLSADGGLLAELVRNRNFQDANQPEHWAKVSPTGSGVNLAVETAYPPTPKNPQYLKVETSTAAGGRGGVANGGFYGMGIEKGETYKLTLLARSGDGFDGPLNISVETASGTTLAGATIRKLTPEWKSHTLSLKAQATEPKARLLVTASKPGTFYLDMVSLVPAKTWRNLGFREDLAEMLVGLKPSFVRFPGGCWVEGDTLKESYRWKQTIGAPAERRTQHNIWAYEATHGIGFHEYLLLSEALGAEPLFCINVGMSHRENVPMDQMGEYVQDALDAIEYANGPITSTWGALRAKAGHPAPFNLKYLEIGNENGGAAYHERYPLFEKAIHARYPQMQLIANVWGGYPTNCPVQIVDEHYYDTPDFFMAEASKYDSYKRTGPKVFVGEYAVTRNAGLGNLRGAIGEAAFMTGMERNSDVVIMAAYAPLFCNANHKRWPINLINYDSTRCFGLPSYYAQQLFSQNRGDVVLPTEVAAPVVQDPGHGGAVGVGTWLTQAEFKDMKVTRDAQTLFAADLSQGTQGWRLHGGDWKVQDGALRQNARGENIRAFIGDKGWKDYTYTLRARKLGGAEGFLIPFVVEDEGDKCWWNLGGWGNTRHALEVSGVSEASVNGQIETGRWYDIRIEVKGPSIKCYLDDRLLHDVKFASRKSLFASATREEKTGDVIVKVVNGSSASQPVDLKLNGGLKLSGPARALVLTSAQGTDENTLAEPRKVVPVPQNLPLTGNTLSHAFPGNSLTVLRIKAR